MITRLMHSLKVISSLRISGENPDVLKYETEIAKRLIQYIPKEFIFAFKGQYLESIVIPFLECDFVPGLQLIAKQGENSLLDGGMGGNAWVRAIRYNSKQSIEFYIKKFKKSQAYCLLMNYKKQLLKMI